MAVSKVANEAAVCLGSQDKLLWEGTLVMNGRRKASCHMTLISSASGNLWFGGQ